MKTALLLLPLLLSATLLTGCGGGGTTVQNTGKSAGEQLEDLGKARDQGLISDREYDRMRKRIVRDND
ncbi:MAG: SHOCT domain-containing protein [Limisphaerales bacterium]